MRNLHEITLTPSTHAWLSLVGRNGHVLGAGQYQHIYRAERGTPPDWGNDSRSWWMTWPVPDNPLQPVCGPIRTTSRSPYLSEYHGGASCPNCLDWLMRHPVEPQRLRELRARDPWMNVPWHARPTTRDPISGL